MQLPEDRRIQRWVRLLDRILPVVIVLGLATPGICTPKQLDLKKLLSQPPTKRQEFIPARVGWDGAEQNEHSNVYMQANSPAAVARTNRAAFQALLIPDWRVAVSLFAIIFVLRWVHRTTSNKNPASHDQPSAEVPRAA